MAWDADPGPKPDPDGTYPAAVPGKINLADWGIK
jgi:hypothetical protein